MESENHLVLISPRRFGKTSLVCKALQHINRPVVIVNLQSVTTVTEFKIPYDDFFRYLSERFAFIISKQSEQIAEDILSFTQCHPYYTQQLAFQVWNILEQENNTGNIVDDAVDELTQLHDFDYERIWMAMNKTDRHILTILAQDTISPLDLRRGIPTSTAFSALKRLSRQGYVIKNAKYEIDDPFFTRWIFKRTL